MNIADLERREGESPTGHMLRGIFAAVIQGFEEAGHPLSVEQLVFLAGAIDELARTS